MDEDGVIKYWYVMRIYILLFMVMFILIMYVYMYSIFRRPFVYMQL